MRAARNAAIVAGLLISIAAAAWLLWGRGPRLPADPLRALPEGLTAAAWVDLPALLASSPWRRLVIDRGGDRGVRRVRARCGFDPLAGIDRVTVFVQGDAPGDLGRAGVLVRGRLEHEALARCVSEVVADDGGSVRRIELDGVPALAGRGGSRAAFVGADGIVGGDERTVRSVLAVARGDSEDAAGDATLARLRGLVEHNGDVVAVAHVPPRWREALGHRVRESVDVDPTPLAQVRALGMGVRLRGGLGAGLVLETADARVARGLATAVAARVDAALESPVVALSSAGPLLRRLQIEAQGADVVATAELRAEQVEELLDLVEHLLGTQGDGGRDDGDAQHGRRRPRPAPPQRGEPEPDEVVRGGG